MKEPLRYGLILGLICFLAAGLLSLVNFITTPKIMAQEALELENSLKEVIPGGILFEPLRSNNETAYYKVLDKNKLLIGVIFKTSARGYSGVIDTLAGMTIEGKIIAIKVLNQNETPGLGSRITEPDFTGQFKGKFDSDLKNIQAITGATISSKAVIDSVKNKASEIMELLKNAK
ncbi:MAG: RnfABCDGE type electron transport complex subunit G [Candidatus Omnitrophota bacterium]|nr:RnfABCDGE type electron transport complex subunit G [Candidatus Omnitrophota bacterium]MBU1929397.1 RnfABCDGE type electron transport complex subunit G [Candidatus Omnitrophota bacterium]MBU2034863.1 RnfABCDGE type electron transport complex subunit G [Candidatus Omnitrophota bacterium]MBU2221081.1 RnfABCDGE type electron transport complex subunit G [Candidatus Omnitrophota bacterium]